MRRWLVCAIAGLVLVTVSFSLLSGSSSLQASATGANLSTAQLGAAGAPPCPVGWTCQAMPCHSGANCGVVEAGPTSDLGPNQWVYLNFYGLPNPEAVVLYYCQDLGSLATSPLCSHVSTQTQPQPVVSVVSQPDGRSSISYQAAEVDALGGPCTGIPGQVPDGTQTPSECDASHPTIPEFFCDTSGSNNCAIDLTVPGASSPPSRTPNAQNTLVIPVSFSSSTGACASAHQVLSESEFGFGQLLKVTDQTACQQSDAWIPFNTEIDGLSALQALDQGTIQMAFTDDPQALSQQAIIKKDNLLVIPVAFSANVIGDHAEMQSPIVPQTGLKLTANLAAGILGGLYSAPSNSEVSDCGQGGSTFACEVMDTLNALSGYRGAQGYSSYLRSDASGTTDQLLAWICGMKPEIATLSALTLSESQAPEDVLINALFYAGGAPTGCLNTDQLPPFISQLGSASEYSTPSQQALKLAQTIVPPGSASSPTAGFAPMNWAESSYFGLDPVLLQNAAGQFVAPTSTSVMSGLADGSWSHAIWTPSFTNSSDSAAYPMPTVFYAVVPRSSISASDKQGIQSSLNSILAITSSSNAVLPQGLLPLSSEVATTAKDEVANGVGNASYVVPSIGQTASTSGSTSGSGSGSDYSNFSFGSGFSFSSGALASGSNSSTTTASAGKVVIPSSSPTYGPITLTASESRLLLPGTISLGGLLALVGVAMMASSGLARRRFARREASGDAPEPVDEEGS
jgi:hypothetical protein